MRISTALLGVVLATAAAAPAGAQTRAAAATVAFRNDLPATYRLQRVRLWVDGVLRYDGAGPFDAALAPGGHVVSVAADYRMHDPVLTYVDDYAFELRAGEHIRSASSRVVLARVIERGGVTTPIDKRAQIVWR